MLFTFECPSSNTDFIFPWVISRVRFGGLSDTLPQWNIVCSEYEYYTKFKTTTLTKLAHFFTKLLSNTTSGWLVRVYEFFRFGWGQVGVVCNRVIFMPQILGISQTLMRKFINIYFCYTSNLHNVQEATQWRRCSKNRLTVPQETWRQDIPSKACSECNPFWKRKWKITFTVTFVNSVTWLGKCTCFFIFIDLLKRLPWKPSASSSPRPHSMSLQLLRISPRLHAGLRVHSDEQSDKKWSFWFL